MAHAVHQLAQVRALVGGQGVSGVPQVVKVDTRTTNLSDGRVGKGPGPSSLPGILLPPKNTVKGAPCSRVATAMGASAHP